MNTNNDAALQNVLVQGITMGIPDWEFKPKWIRNGRGDQIQLGKIWDKTETLEYVREAQFPAEFAPGQRYAYANANYTLLGLIIEAVTGNETATEVRRRILQPLKLTNTFFESFEDVPDGFVNHYHYATPIFVEIAGVHQAFGEIRPFSCKNSKTNIKTNDGGHGPASQSVQDGCCAVLAVHFECALAAARRS